MVAKTRKLSLVSAEEDARKCDEARVWLCRYQKVLDAHFSIRTFSGALASRHCKCSGNIYSGGTFLLLRTSGGVGSQKTFRQNVPKVDLVGYCPGYRSGIYTGIWRVSIPVGMSGSPYQVLGYGGSILVQNYEIPGLDGYALLSYSIRAMPAKIPCLTNKSTFKKVSGGVLSRFIFPGRVTTNSAETRI